MTAIKHLTSSKKAEIIKNRDGETKLGEVVTYLNEDWKQNLAMSRAKFVIIGIPEDIGPRANHGNGGAHHAWEAFLKMFLNTQHNRFIDASSIAVLGSIDCSDLMSQSRNTDVNGLRTLCAEIDHRVSEIIMLVVKLNKIPIVIGGGHNNAYGMLKGASNAYDKAVSCINLDPHADFRPLEGRHSGNGFSYAKAEGFLDQYRVLGLHEAYNSAAMLEQSPESFSYVSHDAIVRGDLTFVEAIDHLLLQIKSKPLGVELDLDSIAFMPSSAFSPEGVSLTHARRYVVMCAKTADCIYLHLPEGAPNAEGLETKVVGKALTYLTLDFIKEILKKVD